MWRARLAAIAILLGACSAPPRTPVVRESVQVTEAAATPAPPPLPSGPAPSPDLSASPADTESAAPAPSAEVQAASAKPPAPPPWMPVLPVVPREETRAVVLMYHSFSVVPGKQRGVLPWELEKHIRLVREGGIEIVPLSRLVEWYEGKRKLPRRVAVVSMDDAEKAQYTLAFPVLKREKVPFVVAIPTAGMEMPWRHAGRFDWSELTVMTGSGLCEVASHGHTHTRLPGLSAGQIANEVGRSRAILEGKSAPIEAFMHPFGAYDGAVTRSLEQAGYKVAFGVLGRAIDHKSPRWGLGRWEINGQTTVAKLQAYLRSAKMMN